jgi:hypothetical protein
MAVKPSNAAGTQPDVAILDCQLPLLNLKTMESHSAPAMRKVNAHSTAALVRYAIRSKLVEPG